jgi:hypothetical protein
MSNQVLNHPRLQAEPPCPRKIPLYIRLSDRLSNPTEVACAKAVAGDLSGRCGRVVNLAELEGLSLYLWSEDDPEGKTLSSYLEGESLLQGLLLETRPEPVDGASGVSAALAHYVCARFEFAAAISGMDDPTLLRARV